MAWLASVTIVPCTGAMHGSRTRPLRREMRQVGSCSFHFQMGGKKKPKQAPKCFKWDVQTLCWDALGLAELPGPRGRARPPPSPGLSEVPV